MKTLLLLILLLPAMGFSQNDTTIYIDADRLITGKAQYFGDGMHVTLQASGSQNNTVSDATINRPGKLVWTTSDDFMIINWAFEEITDTTYVNIALIGSAGSLHIVPGMIITKIDKYGFTEETRYFIKRMYSGKLREIDESQVWEYKPIKH